MQSPIDSGHELVFVGAREVRVVPRGWEHDLKQPGLDTADALAVVAAAYVDERAAGIADDHED